VDDIAGGDDVNGWICSRCSTSPTATSSVHYQSETAGGNGRLHQLVKISDVVLDNSSPGVMGRLGLDQASLEKSRKTSSRYLFSGCGEIGAAEGYPGLPLL